MKEKGILSEASCGQLLEDRNFNAVRKWTLWLFNYRKPFENEICKVFGGTLSFLDGRYCCGDNFTTQHLMEKWQPLDGMDNVRMLSFFCGIDSSLQRQLVDWVMENYEG